jgi:hypothetical protein
MKKGGDKRYFSRGRNMGWRKRRQRKWKKDKEKGRWTKKVVSRKQRGTQERKYEGEGTSKKDNEDGKSEGIIFELSGFKKKKRSLGLHKTI